MLRPKIKLINLNSITINWSNIYCENKEVSFFKLQICDNLKEWKTIYYGPKLEFKVDRLAPCTCYNFRIKNEGHDDWIYFKAATEDVGPYTSVIHMTRALKLSKTSVIRKIAHVKPLLLNIENKENKTPIFQAIEARDFQILHLLVTLGANVNKPQMYTNRTPLMFSIYKGELQAASLLVDKGAQISSKDINGLTIIHYAVDSNELNNVEFAVETGLNINQQDDNGWTPLIRGAIQQCKSEILEYLIAKGADKSFKDRNGFDYRKHLKLSNVKHF